MEVQEVKDKLIDEIKKLKFQNSNLKPHELFENACQNLQFSLETYYREDPSMIFLFSCQILLINKFYFNGKGETKEDSYNNAILHFLSNSVNNENYFTDEINESIKSIDTCEEFITFSKQFFINKIISKSYKINYENIKKELESNVQNKSIIQNRKLTENYRKYNEEIVCSLFLNGDILLQQGKGQNENEAFENATKEFFTSYDILPKEVSNPETKNQFNLSKVLGQLHNHLLEKRINTDYYTNIKKFVESLNYKFEVQFNNGVTRVLINGNEVVKAKDDNEYCSNISACKLLVNKIKKYNFTEQVTPRQHCISTNSNISGTSNDLQVDENDINQENLDKKLKNAAEMAKKECSSNETLDIWSILNRCLKIQGIYVVPSYITSSGQTTCSFTFKNQTLITGSDTNKDLARTAAAKNFIDTFLLVF